MKKQHSQLIAALALASLCLTAPTAFSLPFTDPFNYTYPSALAGLINPEGNAWGVCGTNANAAPPTDIVVTNINLSYPGLAYSSNYAIYYGGWANSTPQGYTERIAVNPPVGTTAYAIDNGAIYYSFVFMVENLAGLTVNGGFVSGFNNTTGPQGTYPSVICGRVHLRLDTANPNSGYQIGVGKAPSAAVDASFATNQFVVGQTNFVVVSYTADGIQNSNDFAKIWINPSPSTFGAVIPPPADLTNYVGPEFGSGSVTAIRSFLFRGGNIAVPMIIADELRIGPTWACVTPPTNAPAATPVNLNIALTTTNSIISWPTNAACFALQSAPSLTNAWTTVYGNFVIAGDKFMITNTLSSSNLFYRLKEF